jgi:2-iminobutanoate/2-iminopropanoate deaminase
MPFSNGVMAGDTFYMSGHIGFDAATKKVPADAEQEARLVLDAFRETLSRAKLGMEDLVFVQVFCSDVALFDKFNAVYRTYFSGEFPARAFLGSGPLLFGARFEVQGIAVRPQKSRSKRRGRR